VTFGSTASPYRGVYINLDRYEDRRAAMEEQLHKLGIAKQYERFPGVEGSTMPRPSKAVRSGAVGCFWSHYRLLASMTTANACVHVLEDDVILSPYVQRAIEDGIRKRQFERFDMVFTEMFVGYNAWTLREFKQFHDSLLAQRSADQEPVFSVAEVSSVYLAGMTSYIVPPHGIERVVAAMRRGLDMGPCWPVDILVRQEALAGRLKLGCIFPFTTTIPLDPIYRSTIDTVKSDLEGLSRLATALLRYSFFVSRDLEGYAKPWLDAVNAKRAARKGDQHLNLMTDMLGFAMSDDFKPI
jgi:GR25 family glycosyltransferase involved in LPS biosynthesis